MSLRAKIAAVSSLKGVHVPRSEIEYGGVADAEGVKCRCLSTVASVVIAFAHTHTHCC